MKLYRPYLTDVSSHVLPSASGTLNLGAAALAWNNAFINKAYLAADPISPLQAATKQYVDNAVSGEDLWDRSGTDLSPKNAGDNLVITGHSSFGANAAIDANDVIDVAETIALTNAATRMGIWTEIILDTQTNAGNSNLDGLELNTTVSSNFDKNISDLRGIDNNVYSSSTGGTAAVYGMYQYVAADGSNATNTYGMYNEIQNSHAGNSTTVQNEYMWAEHAGDGNVTNMYNLNIAGTNYGGGGTCTNQYGIYLGPGYGSATNNYGLYIADRGSIGSSLNYNILSKGATSLNEFEGNINLGGNLTPTASGSKDIGSVALAFDDAYIDRVHLEADPTTPLEAATKQYVDDQVSTETLWTDGGGYLKPETDGDKVRTYYSSGAFYGDFYTDDYGAHIEWSYGQLTFQEKSSVNADTDVWVTGNGTGTGSLFIQQVANAYTQYSQNATISQIIFGADVTTFRINGGGTDVDTIIRSDTMDAFKIDGATGDAIFGASILPAASGTVDVGTIATAFASGYIDEVYLNADPTDPLQAATKQYVDSAISGENWWQRGGTTLSPENANDGLSIAGDTIFNVNTQDVDFTVRTTSDANAFVIHGSTDIIGLGVDVSPDASGTLSLGSVASAFNEAHINKVYLEGDPTTGFEAATKDYVDVQIVAGGGTLQTVTDAGATTSNSMTTSANMTIGEYLYHDGDADTWARFGDNSFTVNTAGVEMAKFTGGTEVVFNDGAQDVDFRVEADNQPNAIKIDGGDGSFTYNTSTSNSSLTPFQVKDSLGYPLITCKVTNTSGSAAGSEIVFNDLSLDYDLRVESDTRTNAFSVNGETGNVGIGQGGAASRLTVYDAANSIIQLCNFDTGVVAGKGTTLYQNSYSSGIGFSSLVTDFTINEGGLDIDFRVESNTHTDAFVLHGDYGSVTFGAANTKYVSIDEDIEAVISAASNGDALVLAAGTFTITNTITVGKRVHLKGQGRGITTIYCSTDIASNSMIQFTTTAGSLISDMTVHLDSATSSNSQILRYDVDVDVLNLELIDTTTGSNQPYGVYNSSSNATMNLWNTTYAGSGANSQHCFVIVSGGNSYANLYDCSATSADGTSSSTGNTLLRTWTGSTNYINVYGGTYESATNASAGGVVYCANGAINLYGATINGSGASAFDVRRDAGSLTLYDTTLVNNTISGTVSYGGTVTAANGEFSPDSDHVGGVIASRSKMGFPTTGSSDYAHFGHLDTFAGGFGGAGCALLQSSAGSTIVNSYTGLPLSFSIGLSTVAQFTSAGVFSHKGNIVPDPSGTLDLGTVASAYNNAYIDSVYLEGDPTDGLEATTKDYVDSLVQGLDWQHSVLSRLGSPPGGPGTGDRYIATATASGWTENNIYQYQSGWDETVANEGMATWVEDEDKQYTYNGVEWVTFGSTSVHNNMSGLQGGTSGEYYHLTAAEYATVDSDTLSDVTGRGATTTDAVGTSTLTITNNSDTVVLDHDGNDAQVTWSDGALYFETSEGTNTTTIVWAKAHGAIPAYSYIGAETAGSFVNFFAGNTGTGIFYDSADTFQIWGQPYADRGTVTNLTERFSISSAGVIEFNNAYAFPSATGTEGQVLKVQADTSVLDWAESGGVTTYAEAFNDGDLTAGILTVTHNLASNYPNVAVYDNSNNQIGPDEITNTDSNTTTIDLSSFGTITGTWNVRVSVGAGGTPSGGSPVGGAGAIQFTDGSDFDGDETKLYWNSASNRLSVGTAIQNKDGITIYSSSTPYVELYNGSTGTTASDGAGIALDGNLDFWLINREVGDVNMYTGSQTVLSAQSGNKVAIAGSHVATSELDVAGDIEVGSTDAFYMGDPTTEGTWRFVRSGNDLVMQRRESSTWVTKSTVVA